MPSFFLGSVLILYSKTCDSGETGSPDEYFFKGLVIKSILSLHTQMVIKCSGCRVKEINDDNVSACFFLWEICEDEKSG